MEVKNNPWPWHLQLIGKTFNTTCRMLAYHFQPPFGGTLCTCQFHVRWIVCIGGINTENLLCYVLEGGLHCSIKKQRSISIAHGVFATVKLLQCIFHRCYDIFYSTTAERCSHASRLLFAQWSAEDLILDLDPAPFKVRQTSRIWWFCWLVMPNSDD